MKLHFLHSLLFVAICTMIGCAQTTTLPTLDEAALRNNLATQFVKKKEMSWVTPDDFIIEAKQPVSIAPNTYFAVKIRLAEAHESNASKALVMTFVTDPAGNLWFESVIDLRDGKEAVISKAPEVTRLKFPASVSPSTFISGTGNADVIFVADPFCPYCQAGCLFLSNNLDKIKNIQLAHNPLEPANGSAVAAWVMEYAQNAYAQPWEVVRFSFSDLNPVPAKDEAGNTISPKSAAMEILRQYRKRFPDLFDAGNGDLEKMYEMLSTDYAPSQRKMHSQLDRAGFHSSPIFIVDGQVVVGMDEANLMKALAGSHQASGEGGLCNDDVPKTCTQ